MLTSFYTQEELENIGFKDVGDNVLISRKASIYSPENMSFGSNIRIDDFCILSGCISINNYVHIAAYSALYGSTQGIYINDFANISSRVCIYAVEDDYSGSSMTNPMVPEKYKNIKRDSVHICRHVIIGSGCTILPGTTLAEGCAIGCMSLIKHDTEAWMIYAGIPAHKIKSRSKELLIYEETFLNDMKRNI